MSGSSSQGGSPPHLAPPIELLKSLAAAIQDGISSYEKSSSPREKASALSKVRQSASTLSTTTTPLTQQILDFTFGPYLNATARIAIEMDLFTKLPKSGEPIDLADLAHACHAEEEFTYRIVRALAAYKVVEEVNTASDLPSYKHGALSRVLEMPMGKALIVHHFDNMLQAQALSAGEYYTKNGFRSPNRAKDAAFGFAFGQQGKGIFDVLEEQPVRAKKLNDAMGVQGQFGLKPLMDAYPFNKLHANEEGIQLVDVGGGNGTASKEMVTSFPEMKGKVVLEDLESVLTGGGLAVKEPDVKLVPYDFFKDDQPVKGSNYFLKWVFHDWSDQECIQILDRLKPALASQSKLLIVELVLQNQDPTPNHTLRDINMLVIGGKERAEVQWKALLGRAGFDLIEVHTAEGGMWTMLEAVLQ